VVHATSNVQLQQQALFHFVNVMHRQQIELRLNDALYLRIYRVEVWAIRWPEDSGYKRVLPAGEDVQFCVTGGAVVLYKFPNIICFLNLVLLTAVKEF